MSGYLEEYNTIEKELKQLKNSLSKYPKGVIRRRCIKGKEYFYLQYRDGKQVKSDYIRADEVSAISKMIEERKETEEKIRSLQTKAENYAKTLGMHRSYRPVKNVDYQDYTLFMSSVAHDYKMLKTEVFIEKYDVSKYRGINKRYLAGFLDYISGIERNTVRRTNDLVLDPYTYLMYFKYGDKESLNQELEKAIPAFLCRGLLITNVQEAVNGTLS